MKKIKYWVDNARWISFPQSLLPALVAFALAYHEQRNGEFNIYLGLLSIVGVILLHFGMNLFDDYFDYKYKKGGGRNELAAQGIKARIAKCPYLKSEGGQSDLKDLGRACLCFCSLALLIGIVIWHFRGMEILYIALVGAFLGIEYSGPPIRLSYHGLGELTIGLMFGPILMLGVYVAAAGVWSWSVLFLALPLGLLVTNIVYTHSVLDYAADKAVNKKTLSTIIDNPKIRLFWTYVFTLLPFIVVTIGVCCGYLSYWYLLVWMCFFMAVGLLYWMSWFIKDPKREFKKTWWMGPVQQWDKIVEAGIEWFMLRWLLARNLIMFFALILILVSFLAA